MKSLVLSLLAVFFLQVACVRSQVKDQHGTNSASLRQLEERIEKLEKINHQLQVKNQELELRDDQFQERIHELEAHEAQKKKNLNGESSNETPKLVSHQFTNYGKATHQELEKLRNQFEAYTHDMEFLKQTVQDQNIQIENIKYGIENITTKNRNENPYVAFTAYAGDTREYMAGGIVQFEHIVNNYGEHYNPIVGIFACPYDGYYLFSVSATATAGEGLDVMLMLDGVGQVGAIVKLPNSHTQATTVFVTLCNAGQLVHVENTVDNSRIYGSVGKHTTFTGAIIQAL